MQQLVFETVSWLSVALMSLAFSRVVTRLFAGDNRLSANTPFLKPRTLVSGQCSVIYSVDL